MDNSLAGLFEHGGPVMWPLLAASILGLAVILDRLLVFALFYQSFRPLVASLEPLVRKGAWARALEICRGRGHLGRLARVYLEHRDETREEREDVLRREGSIMLGQLENRLRWLAVLAQVSTLLGLLATFHVMVVRLHRGEADAGQVQAADFSAAIWEALLTTMFGLMIAIPCSAVYQLCEGRVDSLSRQMGILISYLDEWRRRAPEGAGKDVPLNGSSHPAPLAQKHPGG